MDQSGKRLRSVATTKRPFLSPALAGRETCRVRHRRPEDAPRLSRSSPAPSTADLRSRRSLVTWSPRWHFALYAATPTGRGASTGFRPTGAGRGSSCPRRTESWIDESNRVPIGSGHHAWPRRTCAGTTTSSCGTGRHEDEHPSSSRRARSAAPAFLTTAPLSPIVGANPDRDEGPVRLFPAGSQAPRSRRAGRAYGLFLETHADLAGRPRRGRLA